MTAGTLLVSRGVAVDDADELTIGYGEGVRVPLRVAQTMAGRLIEAALAHVPEADHAEIQQGFFEVLDTMTASARSARPGERVLIGEEAERAISDSVRKLVRQARDERGLT